MDPCMFPYANLLCSFDYIDTTYTKESFHRKEFLSGVFGRALGSCVYL